MSISQIISYEGDNETFVWKHPIVDFNTTTQLIVQESQEAIFFLNGQALDLFGPGRYTLETQNIPIIKNLFNLSTGGETGFKCHVYFINKVEQMALKWGTNSKVQFMEPTYNFPIQIGASGEMSLRAEDSRRLLVKLIGTESILTQEKLATMLRAFIMTRVKSYLARTIRESKINIFEIDERLNLLSDELKEKLYDDFNDYGISLEKFFITTIVKPDGDPLYEKYKELHYRQYSDIKEAQLRQQVGVIDQVTEARRTVINAEGISEKRKIEGYTYQQERGFDVAEKVASNEGSGNFSSAGIGIGMMSGIGGPISSAVGGVFNDSFNSSTIGKDNNESSKSKENLENDKKYCEECGHPNSLDSKFCEECGTTFKSSQVCSSCGYKFEREGKFCPKCGNKR